MQRKTKLLLPSLFAIVILLLGATVASATGIYRVQPGDTLKTIAGDFQTSVDWMATKNNIPDRTRIYPGQVLITPVPWGTDLYKVASGDTLSTIGRAFGSSFGIIANFNKMTDPHRLQVGQSLLIPPYKGAQWGETYTVQQGDTLSNIAKMYNRDLQSLSWYNGLAYPEWIYVGQELRIPAPPAPQAPKPPSSGSGYVYNIPQLLADFPENFFLRGPQDRKVVALTFDDGPDSRYTPMVLDVLAQEGVPATFYLVGKRVYQHPDVVKRIAAEGHVVANHSWSHGNLRKMDAQKAMVSEIWNTAGAIKDLTGLTPALLRPPYGEMSASLLRDLAANGFSVANWSTDSQDWSNRDVDKILMNTLSNMGNGTIVLMHSAGGVGQDLTPTVEALKELIFTLKVEGFQFVTIDELLGVPAYIR